VNGFQKFEVTSRLSRVHVKNRKSYMDQYSAVDRDNVKNNDYIDFE